MNIDIIDEPISNPFQIEVVHNLNQEISNEFDDNIKSLSIELVQLTELLVLNGKLLIGKN
jgi:hypothetical protein